jgi:hypothetical protein
MKKNNKKTASTTEVVIEKEQGVKKAQKKETKAKQEKSFGHKVFFAENYMTLGEIAWIAPG